MSVNNLRLGLCKYHEHLLDLLINCYFCKGTVTVSETVAVVFYTFFFLQASSLAHLGKKMYKIQLLHQEGR